jgi:hypothetical protein
MTVGQIDLQIDPTANLTVSNQADAWVPPSASASSATSRRCCHPSPEQEERQRARYRAPAFDAQVRGPPIILLKVAAIVAPGCVAHPPTPMF